ncbi:S-adenosylmethionine-dependent methyltransferase, putative [Cordyceps militaris CM01]|uniref:S-adenosylmethionine-dependent methyltransferase, putative n=2 Tax=Cordyceps militaris TaxID=73501 RepID=G3JFX7_CORMM|nr:S-adenosylmethionine-dependent methyltransferase, putative [Cordyceps militaris CM01]ATY66669.1 S-adenosylmethionine-dependent methyltransferase, putative [Cordyceps militaris]EGX93211.1 S-adenosylmethionine-dependent methyltransferase, putative [Cordyceps militaris CM01]
MVGRARRIFGPLELRSSSRGQRISNLELCIAVTTLPTTQTALITQSALFNFQSLLLVILLLICTSTYVHHFTPGILDRNKNGVTGVFWKCARIGERLSPYISICCVVMAVSLFFG